MCFFPQVLHPQFHDILALLLLADQSIQIHFQVLLDGSQVLVGLAGQFLQLLGKYFSGGLLPALAEPCLFAADLLGDFDGVVVAFVLDEPAFAVEQFVDAGRGEDAVPAGLGDVLGFLLGELGVAGVPRLLHPARSLLPELLQVVLPLVLEHRELLLLAGLHLLVDLAVLTLYSLLLPLQLALDYRLNLLLHFPGLSKSALSLRQSVPVARQYLHEGQHINRWLIGHFNLAQQGQEGVEAVAVVLEQVFVAVESDGFHDLADALPADRAAVGLHFVEQTQQFVDVEPQHEFLGFCAGGGGGGFGPAGVFGGLGVGGTLHWVQFYSCMGNNVCGNLELDQRVPLNTVGSSYHPSNERNFKEVKAAYLKYPERYAYILSHLNSNQQHFTDEFFDCTSRGEHILGEALLEGSQDIPLWKRLDQVVEGAEQGSAVRYADKLVASSKQYRAMSTLYRLLEWVTCEPKLLEKIFRFEPVAAEGLVLAYLPLFGSHDAPMEIVIDNYIPMRGKSGGDYFFGVASQLTVGMVLVEKVLAKVYGSYENMQSKSVRELFETMVGIPVVMETSNSTDEIRQIKQFFNPNYYIKSTQIKLRAHRSEFVKFTLYQDTHVALSVWQEDAESRIDEFTPQAEVIMELLMVAEHACVRVGYASRLLKEKTILRTASPEEQKSAFAGSAFLRLGKGIYILHLFTRSKKYEVRANVVAYSSAEVNLNYRKESIELLDLKQRMVEHTFMRKYGELQKIKEGYHALSRFLKDGFRCILCIKNEEERPMKVAITIRKEYCNQIRFEDVEESELIMTIAPKLKKLISFIKLVEADVGNFYTIVISLI